MPPSVYELMDETYRRRQWIERLGSPMRGDATFLVEDDNDLLGFGRAGPHASLPRGEVKTLYVATNHHGHGIGHLLMSTMARHLTELGHSRCSVEVVDGNLRAIRFYERLGGSFIGDVVNPGPHWKSRGLIYAWHDLSVFDAIPMPSPVPNPRSSTGTAGGRGSA